MTATASASAVHQVAAAKTPYDAVITMNDLGLNLTPPQQRKLADAIREMNVATIKVLTSSLLLHPAKTPAGVIDPTRFESLDGGRRADWLRQIIAELNEANEDLLIAEMTPQVEAAAQRNWEQAEHVQTHERQALGPWAELGRGPGLTNLLVVLAAVSDYFVDRGENVANTVVGVSQRLKNFAEKVVAPPQEVMDRVGRWLRRIWSFITTVWVFFSVVAFAIILKVLNTSWGDWNKVLAALVFGFLFGAVADFVLAGSVYMMVRNTVIWLVHRIVRITNPRVQEELIMREMPEAMGILKITTSRWVIKGSWYGPMVKQLQVGIRLEGFVRQLFDQDVDNIVLRFFGYLERHNIEYRPEMGEAEALRLWWLAREEDMPSFWIRAYRRMTKLDEVVRSTVGDVAWWQTMGHGVIAANLWLGDRMRSAGRGVITANTWMGRTSTQFQTQYDPRVIRRTARVMRWAGNEFDRLRRRFVGPRP